MENWLLLASAVLAACAAAACFIPRTCRKVYVILWSAAATLIFTGLGLMVSHLLGSRFEYRYVYGHTARGLCALYKVSALWSGQEGSLLLWAAVLAATGFAPMLSKQERACRAFGIYASIAACIFVLCYITQPFSKMPYVPAEGLGLPAALQDPWMAAHPPIVFAAYSAMAVLAAEASGLAGASPAFLRVAFRKWALISWVLLGLGIFTGCVWAYRALGWGGYWSWDPIENAAIVPWLVLGGYLHGTGKAARVKYVIPFALACLGTFLARSGILAGSSAHAYASGNTLVSIAFITAILAVLCWLAVYAVKKARVRRRERLSDEHGMGRKTGAMPIEWAFHLCAVLILAGTIAPLVLGIETPKAYFDAAAVIFALAYAVLLLLRDREALKRRNLPAMVLAAALALGAAVVAGNAGIVWTLLLWICLMPLALWIVCGLRAGTQNWKHVLLHAGAVLLIAGAIVSSGLAKDSYTQQPLILVFWIGGFATALGPCAVFIIGKAIHILNKRKQIRRAQYGRNESD